MNPIDRSRYFLARPPRIDEMKKRQENKKQKFQASVNLTNFEDEYLKNE